MFATTRVVWLFPLPVRTAQTAITGFFDSKMRSVSSPPPSRWVSMVSGSEPEVWSKAPPDPQTLEIFLRVVAGGP